MTITHKPRFSISSFVLNAFLLVLTLCFLIPIYITVINAFKPKLDIINSPLSIPFGHLTLANLARNINNGTFNLFIG